MNEWNEWDPDFVDRSKMFEPLREHAAPLRTYAAWPSREAVDRLLAARAVRTAGGKPLRLVEPQPGGEPYERRIFRRAEMPYRERDWHDFLNALAWLAYPRTKAALNAAHQREDPTEPTPRHTQRGRARDALTLFDESGAIVVSDDASLLEDLRGFRWKRLFWEHREHTREALGVYVFGHALFEKALRPYVGMTAHALVLPRTQSPWRIEDIDALVAEGIGGLASPQALAPVPVLGVPGWFADNAAEAFYDNERYFRPGRMKRPT